MRRFDPRAVGSAYTYDAPLVRSYAALLAAVYR